MTDDSSEKSSDRNVGYKKPPPNRRFKKGQSGNSRGRPKTRGRETLDLKAILNEPVTVTKDGVTQTMSPKDLELRATLQKAVEKKDFNSIKYLIEQCGKYGAINPETVQSGGVLRLPNTMPWRMARMMAERFGVPPWTKAQMAKVREEYTASCTDEERIIDERIGYEDL